MKKGSKGYAVQNENGILLGYEPAWSDASMILLAGDEATVFATRAYANKAVRESAAFVKANNYKLWHVEQWKVIPVTIG